MTTEDFEYFIGHEHFKEATTFRGTHPHQYAVFGQTKNQARFKAAAGFIDKHGVEEKFYTRTFKYFYHNGWKYWLMDPPSAVTIINRARA